MAPTVAPVVVDNASEDDTVTEARARKGVRVIVNRNNRGFAAAVNQGVRAAEADYYLLLNPDVYIDTPIDALADAARQHGLAAGLLSDETGSSQQGFTVRRFPTPRTLWFELLGLNRVWPSNRVNRRYRYLDRNPDQEGPVEQPAGAFLMFRKDVWQTLGGFDEGFQPLWFEDVDFCVRASQSGYRPYLEPKVAARHTGGHSILRIGAASRQVYWCASLLRYAAKHFRTPAFRGVCLAVLFTSVPRAVAGMIEDRSFSPLRGCIRIAGLAVRGLRFGPGRQEGSAQFS